MQNSWTESPLSPLTQHARFFFPSRRQHQLVANGNGERIPHADGSLPGEVVGGGGGERNGDAAGERQLPGRVRGSALGRVPGAGEGQP